MNRSLLFLAWALAPATATLAQQSGVVVYEQKINMHKRLTADQEEMRAVMPEFRIEKSQLLFNGDESLYKNVEEEEPEQTDNNGMQMRIMRPNNVTYRNIATQQRVELREFFGEKFLLNDTLKTQPWKLTGQTKTVKGYPCQQATYTNAERKQTVTAWFTEGLPTPAGPDNFGGLPGLILEVDVNEGEVVFTPLTIELKVLKAGDLKAPTGGRKTNEAAFRKLVDVKMKEMGESGGGGNVIRIRRN